MKKTEPFAVQAAKFSLMAPLVCILLNILSKMAELPAVEAVMGVIGMVAIPSGFILGFVALVGMRQHGSRGILGRAVVGILINGFLIFMTLSLIPALAKAKERAQARVQTQTQVRERIKKASPPTFTPPTGFKSFARGKAMAPDILDAFILGDPTDALPDLVLFYEDLGGTISNKPISAEAIRKAKNARLHTMNWRGHKVDVIEINETIGTMQTVTYNAQIPTIPKAVQVKLVGLASRKPEMQKILQGAINGVDGSTNW